MDNNDNLINDSINDVERTADIEIKTKIQKLKNSAKLFLDKIGKLSGNLEDAMDLSKNIYLNLFLDTTEIEDSNDLLQNIYNDQKTIDKNIQDNEQKIRILDIAIDTCFEFQTAINEFLDIKEIIMTWITPEGEIYHLDLEYEKELLKAHHFSVNKAKFNLPIITQNFINQQQEAGKKIRQQKIEQGHQEKIYKLYKTMKDNQNKNNNEIKATPAFYESYYKNKKGGRQRKPDLFFAMDLNSNLNFKYVSNWGILREAYYAALMDNNATFNGNQNEQANKLYEDYVKRVDNLGGVLGGDVRVINKNNTTTTEYAVKTGQAKSQSFLQYLTIAKKIIMMDDNIQISRDNFNEKIQGKVKEINGQVSQSIKRHLNKELQNLGIENVIIS